jgi:predicted AlkP superfamily pyrophosphatase or phosphodiesterase
MQGIWDMTTGVTMGQYSPDRPAWTAATGERWTKLLVQDKWDTTAEIEQMWQDSTDETYRTREDIWDRTFRTGLQDRTTVQASRDWSD